MTGPRPILVNGRVGIPVQTGEPLTHKHHFYCQIAGTPAPGADLVGPTGNVLWTTAAEGLAALLAPLWHTGDTFGVMTLDQYITGAWINVDSYTPTHQPSGSSADFQACQLTIFIYDALHRPVKFNLLGGNFPPPGKNIYPSGNVDWNNLVADMINHTATHIGFWLLSRSADILTTPLSFTRSLNRKSRRRLGLL